MTQRGFTLIELLVVISIISLLSAIVLTSINNVREKAQTAALAQALKQLDRAFYMWADSANIDTWWLESSFGLGDNPTLGKLIENTNFGSYISSTTPAVTNLVYKYDNDGDVHDPTDNCDSVSQPSNNVNRGVSILLVELPASIANDLEGLFDSTESRWCGQFRYNNNGTGLYNLSYDQDF